MFTKITFLQLFFAVAVVTSFQACRALEPLMPATKKGLVRTLQGHTGVVMYVTFSPDGNTLASSGGDRTVKLWDVMTGQELTTLYEHPDSVYTVAFSPDGNLLASVSGWFYVPLSPFQVLSVSRPTDTPTPIIETLIPTPTVDPLPNKVILWDLARNTELSRWEFANPMYTVTFSPDGRTLAAGGGYPDERTFGEGENAVWLWNLVAVESAVILRERGPVWTVVFSPDGKTLASGNSNGITLWNVETGEAKTHLGENPTKGIAFSSDGTLLATGSRYGVVELWDATTNQKQGTIEAHDGIVDTLTFSPDGVVLASAGQDSIIRLWNLPTLETIAAIRIPKTRISSVAFAPDGNLLVSGSSDGLIRVWDMSEILSQ